MKDIFFNRISTAFPEILLSTSPTPTGLSPGRLSDGVNLLAASYLFDIAFPCRTFWHHEQVLFLMYDLFVCISQIFIEYYSRELIPEVGVGFVIPISVGVVAVTFVIIRCYVITVIYRIIRIDVIFSVSPSAKTYVAVILYRF